MTAVTADPTDQAGPRAATLRPAHIPAVPLWRLVRSEVRWVFRRPRTLVGLGLFAALPIVMGIALAIDDGNGGGGGDPIYALVSGNGLVLPMAALSTAMFLLLPFAVSVAAADALAGEAASGTLRGLLITPVSRVRLVVVKAIGVLAVAAAAVAIVAVVGAISGVLSLGGAGVVTVYGTSLDTLPSIGRVAILAAWVLGQLLATGAIALAISAFTEHPLVVLALSMGFLIVSTVLMTIPALDWLHPVLLQTGWGSIADVLRDPIAWDGLLTSTYRSACYVLIGLALAFARTATRDA